MKSVKDGSYERVLPEINMIKNMNAYENLLLRIYGKNGRYASFTSNKRDRKKIGIWKTYKSVLREKSAKNITVRNGNYGKLLSEICLIEKNTEIQKKSYQYMPK